MRPKWSRVEEVVRAGLEAGAAPGAVAILADDVGVVDCSAFGLRQVPPDDLVPPDNQVPRGDPMTPQTIFRIASMTKAVNTLAVLQLMERGQLSLDQPVGDLIPAFDQVQVIDGWDDEMPRLRPPRRRPTLLNLLTHTSGLTYDALHEQARRYLLATGVPMPSSGLLDCFASPMVVEPGTQFNYGMSSDWTGRVVAEVSGLSLPEYYRRHIFQPLGLSDIGFDLTPEQRTRLAPAYRRLADGSWQDTGFEWVPNPQFHSAGHGLYATAGDFLTIQRVLLGGGQAGGVRIVSPESIELMFTDQMRGLPLRTMRSTIAEFSEDLELGPDSSWGLDLMLTVEGREGMRPAGSGGWAGTFNTFYWVDRPGGLMAGLYMQTLPFFDAPALDLARQFERAVYAV